MQQSHTVTHHHMHIMVHIGHVGSVRSRRGVATHTQLGALAAPVSLCEKLSQLLTIHVSHQLWQLTGWLAPVRCAHPNCHWLACTSLQASCWRESRHEGTPCWHEGTSRERRCWSEGTPRDLQHLGGGIWMSTTAAKRGEVSLV